MDTKLHIIGIIHSSIKEKQDAPKCEHEGGVEARIEIKPAYADATYTLEPGREIWLFTWLHLADRERLQVHPRGDLSRPIRGVFNTRSPDRPNPIGLHRVRVVGIEPAGDGVTLVVAPLEVVDGTPIIDIKPVI